MIIIDYLVIIIYYLFVVIYYLLAIIYYCRYLFNDAEVKSFDPSQIAQECFGGEMTVRTFIFCFH